MTDSQDIPAFGIVDPDGEHGILSIESGAGASCRLTLVSRNERGYPRHELAVIPLAVWRQLATAVQKELIRGMDPEETGAKAPSFISGDQALSPLVTRELSVLLWSLMEDGEGTHIDALLAGWRQLAREERWWLYARASNPAQRQGRGWRRALYYALTDPADTRTAPRLLEIMEAASAQKKTSAPMRKVNYREGLRKKPGSEKATKSPPRKAAKKVAPAMPRVKKTAKKAAKKAAPTKVAKTAAKKTESHPKIRK
jgi:hypothetical protein